MGVRISGTSTLSWIGCAPTPPRVARCSMATSRIAGARSLLLRTPQGLSRNGPSHAAPSGVNSLDRMFRLGQRVGSPQRRR